MIFFYHCLPYRWKEFHVFLLHTSSIYFLFYVWTNWSLHNSLHLYKRARDLHFRIRDSRNRFSVSNLLARLLSCVCIMHNGAHHRISISSFCTHAEKSFCIEQAREALFFFPSPRLRSPPLPYFESTSTSTTAARRWRHVRQSENVWPANTWVDSPTCNTRERDSHNSICDQGRGAGDAEGPLISSRCHFVKPSGGDTLPFLRWRWIGTSHYDKSDITYTRTFRSMRSIWKNTSDHIIINTQLITY